MNLVTIARFPNLPEAELAKERLENEGILSFVLHEGTAGILPNVAASGGGIQLQAGTDDAQRAREVMGIREEEKLIPTPPPIPPIVMGAYRRILGRFSFALFIGMHLACLLVIVYPPTLGLVLLAVASYVLRMWAITVGFHRYFSHRSFRTSRAFQFVLAVLGTAAMENDPIWWASWHRRHHKYADRPGDPHSPRLFGFWYAHVGWVFDPKNDKTDLSHVTDLTKFPELRFLHRHKWLPLVGYALVCYAIAGFAGVVWGFVVSTIVVDHATFLINSLAHVWGSRRYNTDDTSRNNAPLAILTLGEGWHNNHHFYMSAARQGFYWWEIDVSYYSIKVLEWLHIVRDVRQPPPSVLLHVNP